MPDVLAKGGDQQKHFVKERIERIDRIVQDVQQKRKLMNMSKVPTNRYYRRAIGADYVGWALNRWRGIRAETNKKYKSPPNYGAFICIHGGEGSWTDPNDPYWGGLQMDGSFMRSYAPRFLLRRGWANVWTPLQQIWVAEAAIRGGRGFKPWPNTARHCGLI